jgi:hypothetical protein
MRTVTCFLLTWGFPRSLAALCDVGGELVCMECGIGFTTADVKDSSSFQAGDRLLGT